MQFMVGLDFCSVQVKFYNSGIPICNSDNRFNLWTLPSFFQRRVARNFAYKCICKSIRMFLQIIFQQSVCVLKHRWFVIFLFLLQEGTDACPPFHCYHVSDYQKVTFLHSAHFHLVTVFNKVAQKVVFYTLFLLVKH